MDMSWTQLSQKGGKTSKLLAFLRLTSCLLCTAFSYLSYGKHNIWQTCPPTTVRFCYTIYIFSFTFPNCQYFSHEKTWKKTTALLVQASLVPALALQGRPAPVHPAHPAAGRCQGAGRGSLAVLESWTFLVFFVKSKLLGGRATPLKNLKVSWDHDIPNCFWKVIKMFQTSQPARNVFTKKNQNFLGIRIRWGYALRTSAWVKFFAHPNRIRHGWAHTWISTTRIAAWKWSIPVPKQMQC